MQILTAGVKSKEMSMIFQEKVHCAFLFVLMGMLGVLTPSYAETPANKTSITEVKKETQDLLRALKSYTADQRDDAIQKTKATLDKLDKRIEALETRIHNNWDNMDKAARNNARASLKALRKQRTQVAEWYGRLKSSSAGAWDHMKQGLADAYKALHKAWEKAETEFASKKQQKPSDISK